MGHSRGVFTKSEGGYGGLESKGGGGLEFSTRCGTRHGMEKEMG